MKTLTKIITVAALSAAAASTHAISGSISFTSESGSTWEAIDSTTMTDGNILTIDTITSFGTVRVNDADGDFSALVNSFVTMGTPLKFTAPISINNPFWSVGDFEFNLTSIESVDRDSNPSPIPDELTLTGLGIIENTVTSETVLGGWTWGGEMDGSVTFTFSSTTLTGVDQVPEGGASLILLGAALSGMAFLRKKAA